MDGWICALIGSWIQADTGQELQCSPQTSEMGKYVISVTLTITLVVAWWLVGVFQNLLRSWDFHMHL